MSEIDPRAQSSEMPCCRLSRRSWNRPGCYRPWWPELRLFGTSARGKSPDRSDRRRRWVAGDLPPRARQRTSFCAGQAQARAGRSLDELMSFYRVAGQTAWRRLTELGTDQQMEPQELYRLAETGFGYVMNSRARRRPGSPTSSPINRGLRIHVAASWCVCSWTSRRQSRGCWKRQQLPRRSAQRDARRVRRRRHAVRLIRACVPRPVRAGAT